MKKIFLILALVILIPTSISAFRLSRLLNSTTGEDSAPKAYYKWKDRRVAIALAIDSDYPAASTTCSNISNQEGVMQKIIARINSIYDSELELHLTSNADASNIQIYSYSSTEWDSYSSSWGVSSGTLGFASTTAICQTTHRCYFSEANIRLRCGQLGIVEDTSSTYDFESVVQHELIHTLGLDHTAESKAIMYPYMNSDESTKRTFTRDDAAGIVFLYPKQDSPSSILKYLVCGQVNISQPSRLISGLIVLLSGVFLILLLRKRRFTFK